MIGGPQIAEAGRLIEGHRGRQSDEAPDRRRRELTEGSAGIVTLQGVSARAGAEITAQAKAFAQHRSAFAAAGTGAAAEYGVHIDSIAGCEADDAGSERLDRSRGVQPVDGRKWWQAVPVLPADHGFHVWDETGGRDPDQYVTVPGLGDRHPVDRERLSGRMQPCRQHRVLHAALPCIRPRTGRGGLAISNRPRVRARQIQPSAVSSAMALRRQPMPEISTSTLSPRRSHNGGLRFAPTPAGVPVTITSPGRSGRIAGTVGDELGERR